MKRVENMNNDLVLIIDDNPSNVQVLATMMAEYNFELGIAMNANEAYTFLEENIPNIILLDIEMPGINGYEVCSTLKNDLKYSNIPIIFLTVKSENEDIVKGFELGAVDYITKPFNKEELISRVRTHISLNKVKDQLENKTRELENALKMKDEFISFVSHEFKTPLTVINAAIQAMELICKNELSEKTKNFINKIRQNSFRQLRLVNNLLDITRINGGSIKFNKKNLDIVFITKSIIESVNLYALQKNIQLSFITSIDQKIISIDEEKYERILLNVLSNAIKFTPHGKSINVSLSIKSGYICVKIQDCGVGIPKDKQKIIFERFGQVDSSLTRQSEGTGIGLSLVKKLVEALGGSISVKSKVGIGSTFTILLPAEKIADENSGVMIQELADNRLIQATAVEFSDIYLKTAPTQNHETTKYTALKA